MTSDPSNHRSTALKRPKPKTLKAKNAKSQKRQKPKTPKTTKK
jgi:hypothetical protein